MCFKKKNNVINIEPNEDLVMWEIPPTEIGYDCVLNVPIGYQVVYYENGVRLKVFKAGRHSEKINPKKNKKNDVKVGLVVATDSEFDIKFAAIDIPYIDYTDREKIATEIAIRVDGCKVRINNPNFLYRKIGKNYDAITSMDIVDFLRVQLTTGLTNSATKIIANETYFTLNSKMEKLSAKVADVIEEILQDYGVAVRKNSVCTAPNFDDEYKARRAKALEDEAAARAKRREDNAKNEVLKKEIDMINSLNVENNAGGERKCPHCNLPVESGAKFCPKCGKKI